MNTRSLDRALSQRGADATRLARALAKSPEHLDCVLDGLRADAAAVRFNSSKTLLALAEESPETLRPCIGSILELLDSENKLLKAAAIRTLGHLAPVDSAGRFTRALPKILAPIPGPDLVVACNALEGAGMIARAKPRQTARVVEAILSVRKGRYRTAECRNIAIGKALDALEALPAGPTQREAIERFARQQRKNPRKSTRMRAERLLRRIESGGA